MVGLCHPGPRQLDHHPLFHGGRTARRAGHKLRAAPVFGTGNLLEQREEIECINWRNLREIVRPDPAHYMASDEGAGSIGTIKAFRDPGYFRDPANGRHYLFFSGSLAGSHSAHNGVVGVATAPADAPSDWTLLPPVISADGLNNELERPHVVHHDGLYYLFWVTQAHVFNPAGPTGPTGLYGMVSSSLLEDWEPLNGTGLVLANPPKAPAQAYSWWVMADLSVTSFVDQWGADAASQSPRRFGGTFAPFLRLRLDGAKAHLEA
jgi:levansucrase